MVGQELNTFSIEKPTTVSTEEGDIKKDDLPEVVICTEPGLDLEELDKYGYLRDMYYRGSHDGKKFVGWNGVKNEKPSKEILEEVLRIKNTSLIRLDGEGGFSEDLSLFVAANISVRKLMYPHGSCLSINPPDSVRFGYKSQMTLHFELNNSEIVHLLPKGKDVLVLKTYFMDKVNSALLFPENMERRNEMRIELNPNWLKGNGWFNSETSIKIKIKRSHHVQGDPLLDCTDYTTEKTYHDCIHDEILDIFDNEIGCAPPLLARSLNSMCNTTFNLTDDKDLKIKQIFRALLFNVMEFSCKTPCTQRTYRSIITHQTPYKGTSLYITFSPRVEITKSKFQIDAQTLLTRFGGSVSSGRTLLWILLSFVSVSQVSLLTSESSFLYTNSHTANPLN